MFIFLISTCTYSILLSFNLIHFAFHLNQRPSQQQITLNLIFPNLLLEFTSCNQQYHFTKQLCQILLLFYLKKHFKVFLSILLYFDRGFRLKILVFQLIESDQRIFVYDLPVHYYLCLNQQLTFCFHPSFDLFISLNQRSRFHPL